MGNRILGIDLGDVRTGLAVSDEAQFLANGIGTVRAKNRAALLDLIAETASEYQVCKIVMGYPINMNGTLGERSARVRAFADLLTQKTGLDVTLFDERCSTMAAHQILNFTDTYGKKRKETVDTLSAQIILQDYLDAHYKK